MHRISTYMKKRLSGFKCKLLLAAVIYWLITIAFFYITGDVFQYDKSDAVLEMLPAENAPVELCGGVVLEQPFEAAFDRLRSVSVIFSNWGRENAGEILIEVLDEESGDRLGTVAFDAASIEDFRPCVMTVDSSIGNASRHFLIRLSSSADEGSAPAPFVNSSQEIGPRLRVNGVETADVLCFSVEGDERLWIGKYYWPVAAGVFLLVFLYVIHAYSQYKKQAISLPVKVAYALKKYKFLIKQLVNRDFKAKYKRSILGIFWSFLNPLLNMMVQYIVFSNLFRFEIEYFPVYLLCGNVIFSYFSESSGMAISSITGNAHLITKVYVPKYVYPLTRILSSLINLVISLIPLFLVALISGLQPTFALLLLPYPLICLAFFCFGIGMLLAAGMVFFRDVQFLWGVLTTIWMYLTPIFYPVSILEEHLKWVIRINPLYYYITFVRSCVISGVSPPPALYVPCAAYAIAFLLIGGYVFKKTQDYFVLYL